MASPASTTVGRVLSSITFSAAGGGGLIRPAFFAEEPALDLLLRPAGARRAIAPSGAIDGLSFTAAATWPSVTPGATRLSAIGGVGGDTRTTGADEANTGSGVTVGVGLRRSVPSTGRPRRGRDVGSTRPSWRQRGR